MFAASIATSSRLFLLGLVTILLAVCFEIVMWSLDQTILFSGTFIPNIKGRIFPVTYAVAAGLFVQLYPTIAFLISGTLLGGWKTLGGRVLITSGLIVNGLDAYTNVGAVTMVDNWSLTQNLSPETQAMVEPAKLIFAVFVTQFEELISFLIAIFFHLLGLILEDFGVKSPSWFLAVERVGFSAAYSVGELGDTLRIKRANKKKNAKKGNRKPPRPQAAAG